MTTEQITEYLNKYRITNKKLLVEHILQLKRNTKPNVRLISELVYVLEDKKAVFNSFLAKLYQSHISIRDINKAAILELEKIEEENKDDVITNVNRGEVEMIGLFNKISEKELKTEKLQRIKNAFKEINKIKPMYLDEILAQSNTNSTRHKSREGECHLPPQEDTLKTLSEIRREEVKIIQDLERKEGVKETEGKLFYELDFQFIKQMAERMQSNKENSKYELWNWKKPMTPKGIEDLKQALLRHLIEVLEDNYEDDGRVYGHLEAISNNAMIINYQLKNK